MTSDSNLRALVIEDDQEMARLLARIISSRFAVHVDIVHDCASAQRRLDERDYDLITLDYRLPDGAGLDLLDDITGGGRPHPPVIMVTGHGDEDTAARSFRSRASGYVVKDAKLPELLTEAVQKAVSEVSLKRVERELLDEKVFIEDVLNGLPDLFAVVDLDGRFFRWNEKLVGVTGYSNAEISRMTLEEMFVPEDRRKVLDGMKELEKEPHGVCDLSLETRSGERRRFEVSGRLLRNREGMPIGYSGIGRDVTERVSAERELAALKEKLENLVDERTSELQAANEQRERELAERIAAEEHYRSILENSLDVIAILDQDGAIVEISPSIEPLLGYKPAGMIGKSVLEFVHPDDASSVARTHESVAAGAAPSGHVETRFRHRDGSWHTLSVAGRSYTWRGGEVRVVVNARDVSDTLRAQEALRESEERYRKIFEISPDLVFLIGKDGTLTNANAAMLERQGRTLEELRGCGYMEFFAGNNEREVREAVERLRRGEEVRGLEVLARGADGRETLYEINAIPFLDESGDRCTLSLARDVTARKEAEERLIELNRELEGYAQTVSHDLRSPLTAIKLAAGNLETIVARMNEVEDLEGEVSRIAEIIEEGTSRAEALIDDLLVLARAGQEPEEVSDVDVSSTVDRILREHAPQIERRDISVALDEDLGTVRADPTHVYQVFSNLIDNGIRYNDSPRPALEVKYLGDTSGGHTYLVKDNGPGIPPDKREDILLPFYRGKNGSTGIGLAIVQKIVKRYGGTLRVYSNGGACFQFSFKDR